MGTKKIYLDACSWCRPYDDLSVPGNYIESEAVLEILQLSKQNLWTLAASEVIDAELLRMKDVEKLENVIGLYNGVTEYLKLTEKIKQLAVKFQHQNIKLYDSLHLATAEVNGYDYFLTTDNDFRKNALKLGLKIQIYNPAEWILMEVLNATNENN